MVDLVQSTYRPLKNVGSFSVAEFQVEKLSSAF
jgi:hypothetical protein